MEQKDGIMRAVDAWDAKNAPIPATAPPDGCRSEYVYRLPVMALGHVPCTEGLELSYMPSTDGLPWGILEVRSDSRIDDSAMPILEANGIICLKGPRLVEQMITRKKGSGWICRYHSSQAAQWR